MSNAVLSAALHTENVERAVLREVLVGALSPDDIDETIFTDAGCRAVCRAIRKCQAAGEPVDAVHAGLRGDAGVIGEILAGDYVLASPTEAVQRLREQSFRRRTAQAAAALANACDDPGVSIEAIIERTVDLTTGIPDSKKERLPEIRSARALTENPPELQPEIIQGLLRQGGKLILSGPSKSGKTFSLIRLALAVANGKSWFALQCNRTGCLYVNFEISAGIFVRRLKAVASATDAGFEGLHIWNLRGCVLDPGKFADALIERCPPNIGLIIIDPIYKIELSGSAANENDAAYRAAMLRELDRVAEQTKASVAYCAHFPKGSQAHRSAIDRASGSGVIARDADALVCMTPLEEEDCYEVEFIARDFACPKSIRCRWQYPVHVIDDDLDGVRLKGRAGRKPAVSVATLSAKLRDGMSILEAADEVGVSDRTVRRILSQQNSEFTIENGIIHRVVTE